MWRIIENTQTWNILFAGTHEECYDEIGNLKVKYTECYMEEVTNTVIQAVSTHVLYNSVNSKIIYNEQRILSVR